MLYYTFSLLVAAIILLFSRHRSETNRWAAFFLCSASIGGLTGFLTDNGLNGWSETVQILNHVLTPYGVLIFSIVYSELLPRAKTRLWLKGLLLLPAAAMLIRSGFPHELRIDFLWLLFWAGPYYLISCYLLIHSLWKERDRRKKRNRFITTVIIVPTLLAVLVFINIGNALSPEFDFFKYVSLFISYSLAVALLCAFVYGVLGVKFRIERDPLESTMKAVSTGAALLNHTIKNEIGKIAISTENVKRANPELGEESLQHLQIIESSSEHMLAMVARIHSQMKGIALREQLCPLDRLVDECLLHHRQLLDRHGLRVANHYECRPVIRCDAVHIKEALGNLLMNAVEAAATENDAKGAVKGTIEIWLERDKRGIRLSVRDTGKGIPADQLAQVVDPFFSTKNGARNFGLGLSYVYNVMQKSGGSLELSSKEGEGTVAGLRFPRSKIVELNRRDSDEPH